MKIVIYKDNEIKKILSMAGSDKEAIEKIERLKKLCLIDKDDKYKIFKRLKDTNVKDIRALKDDGSVLSLEEQVNLKIIELKEDEEIRDGQIYKLDRDIDEDLIKLIDKGVEKLDDFKKITTHDDGSKHIEYKTAEELYKDKVISAEEYNDCIVTMRQADYQNKLDGERAELLEEVLKSLADKGLLTDGEKERVENINKLRIAIKEKYKKVSEI